MMFCINIINPESHYAVIAYCVICDFCSITDTFLSSENSYSNALYSLSTNSLQRVLRRGNPDEKINDQGMMFNLLIYPCSP